MVEEIDKLSMSEYQEYILLQQLLSNSAAKKFGAV